MVKVQIRCHPRCGGGGGREGQLQWHRGSAWKVQRPECGHSPKGPRQRFWGLFQKCKRLTVWYWYFGQEFPCCGHWPTVPTVLSSVLRQPRRPPSLGFADTRGVSPAWKRTAIQSLNFPGVFIAAHQDLVTVMSVWGLPGLSLSLRTHSQSSGTILRCAVWNVLPQLL